MIRYLRVLWKYLLESVLCVILGVLVIVLLAQVMYRYVLHLPLPWTEEVARYLLIWLVTLGAAYAFKTKAHFSLEFVLNRFSKPLRRIVAFSVGLVVSFFLSIFVVTSFKLIELSSGQTAPITGIPLAVPVSAAPIGGSLMLYFVVKNMWIEFRKPPDSRNQ